MKVLSLFDGVSCGMIALQRAGYTIDRYVAYEIDDDSIKVSEKNFPQIEHCGDVFNGDYTQYKDFDILIGGSPCTYWTIARSKDRETDSEGYGFKLFQQYVRALNESGVEYFLYENNYKIHEDIVSEITKSLGVKPIMINSALVSGQQRFRLYWTNIPNVEQPTDRGIYVRDIITENPQMKYRNYIEKATIRNDGSIDMDIAYRIGEIGKGGQAERIYTINGKSPTLKAKGGGQGAKTGLYLIGDEVRKLSPLEAERLQTLPDNYTSGLSDIKRYRCIGDGWTCDVISHILKGMR